MTQADEVWYRLEVLTTSSELLATHLWDRGALGVEVQDRDTFMEDGSIAPVPDGQTRLIAFFDVPFSVDELPDDADVVSHHRYDDRSWETAWKRYFHPVRVSRRATVGPPWESFDAPDGGIRIEIEPGMAFGTGTHETTRVCSELLDEFIERDAPATMLDVGCGTGVLSMIASGLGVAEVTGIDIDQTAVEVAKENLRLNGYSRAITVSTAPLGSLGRYDLVVANILAHILIDLKDELVQRVQPGGTLLTSGITTEQATHFFEQFADARLELLQRRDLGEWVAFAWKRRD